jgi:hypothetical protein
VLLFLFVEPIAVFVDTWVDVDVSFVPRAALQRMERRGEAADADIVESI